MAVWDNVLDLSPNMGEVYRIQIQFFHFFKVFGYQAFSLKILWKKCFPYVKFHLGQIVLSLTVWKENIQAKISGNLIN